MKDIDVTTVAVRLLTAAIDKYVHSAVVFPPSLFLYLVV